MNAHAQGASAPIVFPYTTSEIRVILIDEQPWFVAADVCRVLEIAKPENAYGRLDEDEKGTHTVGTPGGPQEMTIINESGLYSLILTSRKPEAKKFKKWVTAEVLPAIRKTGRYVHAQAAQPAPLGEIAQWVVGEYTRSLGRYLNRSNQQISPRIHTHLRAKFGVGNVRDIPADRLDELLNLLEAFHGQAYRLWWTCLNLELALLQTLHVPVHETRRELPAAILQAMAAVAEPKLGEGSAALAIRDKAFHQLAARIPRQESLPLH